MAILSMNEIMAADDITEQEVPIPEWGGSVVVRSISHRVMRDIRSDVAKRYGEEEPPDDEIDKWIIIKGMVNPTVSEEDYEHLVEKSYSAIMKIQKAILGNSNGNKESVKEEEKNFPSESE